MWPSRSSKSTMPPPDPTLPPKGLLIPMTQTLPPSIHPLTLPEVIQPPPPDSPTDPDLDNTVLCEAFTFDDSSLDHIMVTEVCQLLEVSWQMCHAWIAHWTVDRATLTISRRRSTRDERTHGRNAHEPLLARM